MGRSYDRYKKHYRAGCNSGRNQTPKILFESGHGMNEDPQLLRTGGGQVMVQEALLDISEQGELTSVLTFSPTAHTVKPTDDK